MSLMQFAFRSWRALAFVGLAVLAGCGDTRGAPAVSGSPAALGATATAAGPSASLEPIGSAPVVAATASPSAETSDEPGEPELPSPSCPSPPFDGKEPVVTASVSSGDSVRATTEGSSVLSCSTVGVSDGVPTVPKSKLTARINDQLTLTLPSAWRLVRWSGYERATEAESVNVWPLAETPERPRSVAVFAIGRTGESILAFELVAVRADGAAVARLTVGVRVDVR